MSKQNRPMKIPSFQICFHVCSECREVIEITLRNGKETHRGHREECDNIHQQECFESSGNTRRE